MNRPRLGRALLLLLLTLCLAASTAWAEATRSPQLNALDARAPLQNLAVREQPGIGQVIDLFLSGDVADSDLEALGVQTHSRLAGGIRTVTVPVARLADLARVPGLTRITASHRAHKLNNASVPRTNATPGFWTPAGAGVFNGDAGQGVIVGIVDTGIDWTHDDFKKPNGTTRILYVWDQNDAGGPNPPEFNYGTQWTAANINANTPRETDADGHGTHVSGTAAGDGSATGNAKPAFQFTGMAPLADIIVVATDFQTADITDGVNYIFQKAQALGKNAVVNLSLGTQFGAHDGTEVFDTSIDALTGPGKIVCAAAGNDGGSGIHARQLVPPGGGNQTITFTVPSYTPTAGASNDFVVVDAYYPASASMRVTLTSPGPNPVSIGPVSLNGTSQNAGSAAGALYVENGSTPSPSGDRNVYIQIFDQNQSVPPRSGTWTITLAPVTTSASTALDLWLADFSIGGAAAAFTSDVDDHDLVSSPGSAAQAVTVGAWITKGTWPSIDGNSYSFNGLTTVGDLASYSSPGPLRNGAQKPDIAAPGSAVVSSRSIGIFPGLDNRLVNPDGVHYTETGTSMASPHVTGAVALLLEAQPNLTPDQIKSILSANAIVDDTTGTVPNAFWGYGKLHILNGDLVPPVVTLSSPNGGEQLPTQSPQSITWTATDNVGVTNVDLALSLNSGTTWGPIANGVPNTGTYAWTVPTTQSTHAMVRVSAHDQAGNLGSDQSAAVFTIVDTSTVQPPLYAKPEIVVVQPNPFNISATIGLGLPAQDHAKIAIFSIDGRLVRTLADGTFSAGYHPFTWDGRDDDGRMARSGIYFLKLTSGGTTQSRRIAMVK